MSLSSLIWGSSQFDEAVERATSELLPAGSEDIALNLEICDQIRSKLVTPNAAMKSLKARINHKNPNVQLLALILSDTCIKNGGDGFVAEITAREFIDNLVSILKQPGLNQDVKLKLLYYIQLWSIGLEKKATMGYLGTVYKTLRREGFEFPPADMTAVNEAMTETRTAPEWIDSEVCLRCRTAFSFTNRKHHCRNCGQVFDQQCSSKVKTLPHFGIAQAVRVCDGCYTALDKIKLNHHHKSKSGRRSKSQGHVSPSDFDRDLQRALELSLMENKRSTGASWVPSEPPLVDRSTRPAAIEEDDPDLRAAIEASLREAQAPRASAPPSFSDAELRQHSYQPHYISTEPVSHQPLQQYAQSSEYVPPSRPAFTLPNYDLHPQEEDAVLSFNQTIEDAQAQGGLAGRHSSNVNELYEKASRVRPKLAMGLDDADRKQQMLLEMNDKIAEVTKLYDKHLNYALQPAWRRQPAGYPTQAQPQYQQQAPPQQRPEASTSAGPIHSDPNGCTAVSAPRMQSPQQTQWPQHAQQIDQQHHAYPVTYQPLQQPAPASIPPQHVSPTQPSQHQLPSPVTIQQQSYPAPQPPLAAQVQPMYSAQQQPQVPYAMSPPPTTTGPSSHQLPQSHIQAHHIQTNPQPQLHEQSQPPRQVWAQPAQSIHQQHHPQRQPLPANVNTMPIFPSVPAAEPEEYGSYSPYPQNQPAERQEALLIDL